MSECDIYIEKAEKKNIYYIPAPTIIYIWSRYGLLFSIAVELTVLAGPLLFIRLLLHIYYIIWNKEKVVCDHRFWQNDYILLLTRKVLLSITHTHTKDHCTIYPSRFVSSLPASLVKSSSWHATIYSFIRLNPWVIQQVKSMPFSTQYTSQLDTL